MTATRFTVDLVPVAEGVQTRVEAGRDARPADALTAALVLLRWAAERGAGGPELTIAEKSLARLTGAVETRTLEQ